MRPLGLECDRVVAEHQTRLLCNTQLTVGVALFASICQAVNHACWSTMQIATRTQWIFLNCMLNTLGEHECRHLPVSTVEYLCLQ